MSRRVVSWIVLALCLLTSLPSLAQERISTRFDNLYGRQTIASFDYSDDFFAAKSTSLNGKLAIASVSLAASAHFENYIKETLQTMGFSDIRAYDFDMSGWTIADNEYSSHTLARKDIAVGGRTLHLYAVMISGTRGYDWISDFNVGNSVEHEGFSGAAARVMKNIEAYVDTPASDNVLWIAGHSRGAAVGNLIGARLSASGTLAPLTQIFTYTSATPRVTTKKNYYKKTFKNIFMFNNPADFVTAIPMAKWGYKNYGREVKLPGSGKNYQKMRAYFKNLVGYEYGGMTPAKGKNLVSWCLKYAPARKHYLSGADWKNGWGIHNPSVYFGGLTRLLIMGKETDEGLQMILGEVKKSRYAVNITAALMGLKTPCDPLTLLAALQNINPDNIIKSIEPVAFCHTLEAYVSWVNALYGS